MKVLAASDVLAIIDSFLNGQIDAQGLEAWAERHEMAEDVDYAEADRVAVVDALFLLANPSINGALTKSRVEEIRCDLLQAGAG